MGWKSSELVRTDQAAAFLASSQAAGRLTWQQACSKTFVLTCSLVAGIERRLELVRAVGESIELVHTNEAAAFLTSFCAPCLRLLQTTAPAFQEGPLQQLRSTILSALSR